MRALTVVVVLMFAVTLSGQPLDVTLVLDLTPGTEQAISLIRPRVFDASDGAGVIGFTNRSEVILPTL